MQDASNNTITMRDADPATVELLLQHTYGIQDLRIPVAAVVDFYKLADQYQVAAAKESLMQASILGKITSLLHPDCTA